MAETEPDFRWLYGNHAADLKCADCGALFSPRRALREYTDEHHSCYVIVQHNDECTPCWLKRVDRFVHGDPYEKRMMWINDQYPHGLFY